LPKIYRVKTMLGSTIELELVEKTKTTIVFKNRKSGQLYKVSLEKANNNRYVLNINGEKHYIHSTEKYISIDFTQPLVYELEFETIEEEKAKPRSGVVQQVEQNVVVSPITGRVVEVKVKPGVRVNTGDTVALLESMKMIIEIKSHLSGVVEEVYVTSGKPVNKGEKIVRIRPL